jgi:hypothetical protein
MEQWNDTPAEGFASGCAPNMDGREEVASGTPTKSSTTSLGSFVLMDEPSAFREQNREPFSESRMREKRLSGSMSGKRNQSHVKPDRGDSAKAPSTATGRLPPLRLFSTPLKIPRRSGTPCRPFLQELVL